MTIEFLGKQLDKYERWKNKPYIGYFTPEGKLVDYNTSLGGSHGQLGNIGYQISLISCHVQLQTDLYHS